jgi:hypothetical protein
MNEVISPPVQTRRISDSLSTIVLIILLLLVARLTVHLAGAQANHIAETIVNLTDFMVAPFKGMLPSLYVGSAYFEPETALTILVVIIAGNVVIVAVDMVRLFFLSRPRVRVISLSR